jgi:hypothetical protein
MSEIDLGVSAKDKYSSGGIELAGTGKEIVYPCFHYCGPEELDLPDEGEMTIRFRKKKETSSVEEDGSHWYECEIEVRKITEVDGEDLEVEAPAHSNDEAGDALDKIAEGLMKLREHEEGEDDEESY